MGQRAKHKIRVLVYCLYIVYTGHSVFSQWPQCYPLFLHVSHPVEDADNDSSVENAVLFNHSNEDILFFFASTWMI